MGKGISWFMIKDKIGFKWAAATGVAMLLVACEGDSSDRVMEVDDVPQALTTCSGEGCTGKWPHYTPCGSTGVFTARSGVVYRNGTSTKIGTIEERCSSACGTCWTRITRSDGAYAEAMNARIKRSDGVIKTQQATGYTQIVSPMVYTKGKCVTSDGLIDQSFTSGSTTLAKHCM